jgi:hypothetical protein
MDIESLISIHLNQLDPQQLATLSHTFRETSVATFDNLIPKSLFLQLKEEVNQLLASESKRRNVFVKESGNTPRAYHSVGRDAIAKHARILPAIFHSDSIRSYLSSVIGEILEKVPYEPEEFIINNQKEPGDTHGWHWDDYAYAFIWMIEEPDPLAGGRVEFIPNIDWKKQDTEQWLKYNLANSTVYSEHIKTGQVLFNEGKYDLAQGLSDHKPYKSCCSNSVLCVAAGY